MAKKTNIYDRQRLIELYNLLRVKTQKAIDTWRRDNHYPKVTFRPEEWKDETDLRKAMLKHENSVNLIYMKQTMTERDVEWVIKDIVDSLITPEKNDLWRHFTSDAKMQKVSPSEKDAFKPFYDYYLSNEQNIKAFKKWKKNIENELAKQN